MLETLELWLHEAFARFWPQEATWLRLTGVITLTVLDLFFPSTSMVIPSANPWSQILTHIAQSPETLLLLRHPK
jgi:hypothetical protein